MKLFIWREERTQVDVDILLQKIEWTTYKQKKKKPSMEEL